MQGQLCEAAWQAHQWAGPMTMEAGMAHVTLRNFVNGKHTDPCEGTYSDVIDPSTGAVYAHAPVSSSADVY